LLARASSGESVSQNQNPKIKFKENEVLDKQSRIISQFPRRKKDQPKHKMSFPLNPFALLT
jgi:hypothetical protein